MSRTPEDLNSRRPETKPQLQLARTDRVTLFLTGDVMTGRGIDQVLPHPSNPRLYESYMTSADHYVRIAELANGPIPKPVDFPYVWGDALAELDRRQPQVRLINLETAVTRCAEPEPKGINYKMSPENFPVITAAGVDCCILANNHILDWGQQGLSETLQTLETAGVPVAGAGRTLAEAHAPAILQASGIRVIVFAFGSPTSGIPAGWAATKERPGVNFLPELNLQAARRIGAEVRKVKSAGDIVVASLHWGSNWGYEIPDQHSEFARGLIDEAEIDVIHGHSSHHPRAIEVYRNKLILYGCGDFLDDYEGIGGYEAFRDDLVLMYFPTIRPLDGALEWLAIVPLQIRNFRLHRASPDDTAWLRDNLNEQGKRFGTRVCEAADDTLALVWT